MSVQRLSLTTLELWKRKAAALDMAVEFLEGQIDSELALEVYQILKDAQ